MCGIDTRERAGGGGECVCVDGRSEVGRDENLMCGAEKRRETGERQKTERGRRGRRKRQPACQSDTEDSPFTPRPSANLALGIFPSHALSRTGVKASADRRDVVIKIILDLNWRSRHL